MDPLLAVISAVVGYLLGSISFARVINRWVAPDIEIDGQDFEVEGRDEKVHFTAVSGTAVSMKLGAKWGGITAILDILKVVIPTLMFRLTYRDAPYYLLVASTGLVGHVWPVYYRFKGGRGLSPIYGGLLVIDLVGSLVTAVVGMFVSLFVLRQLVISYMAGLWLMIPWIWFFRRDPAQLAYVVFVNVMFVIAMIPDLREIIEVRRSGAESDLEKSMESMPMTRMIKKMGIRMGMFRDEK
jgi:acyl phosphate:glycerol-3-phosphate acyltransferase